MKVGRAKRGQKAMDLNLARHVTVFLVKVLSQLLQPLVFTGQERIKCSCHLPHSSLWKDRNH